MALAPTAHKPVISTASKEAHAFLIDSSPAGSSAALTANRGYFTPLVIRSPYLVRRMWWANGSGTIAGNADVGIYTIGGTLLVSTGATAQSGTSVLQSVTLGTPFLLTPGRYYMGFSPSSGTATYTSFGTPTVIFQQFMGWATAASVHPLPATVTFASMTTQVVPLFGIASAGVI